MSKRPADDAPATFDKPYTGMGGSAGGVVGMIEVIESDFARLEAETSTAESEAAEEYQKLSDESAQDKAVKQMDVDNKSKDRTTAESDLSDTKKDLQATRRSSTPPSRTTKSSSRRASTPGFPTRSA